MGRKEFALLGALVGCDPSAPRETKERTHPADLVVCVRVERDGGADAGAYGWGCPENRIEGAR